MATLFLIASLATGYLAAAILDKMWEIQGNGTAKDQGSALRKNFYRLGLVFTGLPGLGALAFWCALSPKRSDSFFEAAKNPNFDWAIRTQLF